VSLTGAVFLIAFATGVALALFKHPRYGLYTYIAVFYLNPPSRWWGQALPDLRWALFAAAVTVVACWRFPPVPGRAPWLSALPAKALVLFTVWLWVQNEWALDPAQHWEACLLFTKYVVLYWMVYRLVVTPADVSRFLVVHLLGCAYLGWLAYTTDVSGRLEGVGGPGIDEANAFAMHMSTGVVAGAMICLAMPGLRRWAALVTLPFILNGVILSGSRGGFLALLAGGLVLWVLKPSQYKKLFYLYSALAVVLFSLLAHQLFWDRVGTIEAAATRDDAQIDESALSRFAIVDAQLRMAADYPLGAGHRGTAVLSPRYLDERFLSVSVNDAERRRSSHNTFMTALVEQGIPGAVWFVWISLWSFAAVWRLKLEARTRDAEYSSVVAAVAAGLAIVFVAGLFVDYLKAEVQIWLWALLAVLRAYVTDAASVKQPAARKIEDVRAT
jgi:hypothetical protein